LKILSEIVPGRHGRCERVALSPSACFLISYIGLPNSPRNARIWVTQIAQAHPLWCFPIAFFVAFAESFVGLSILVPGFAILVALGGVIGASDIGLFPAIAGAVSGRLERRRH